MLPSAQIGGIVMPELAGFAVASNQDGALEIVAVAQPLPSDGAEFSGAVWSARQTSGSDRWSRRSLGPPSPGFLRSGIAIAANRDGRLESVVVSEEQTVHAGTVWHAWQTRPGGDWSRWESLASPGGTIFDPVLASDHDGRLEVFTNTLDGKTWHRRQPLPGHGPWERWQSLGSPLTVGGSSQSPTVVRNHRERLEVFTVANGLWHRWQTASGNNWSAWSPLQDPGGQVGFSSLTLARTKDRWLDVFTIASDGAIWHLREQPGGKWDRWMPFNPHPGWLAELSVGTQADGRLVLFTIGRRPDGVTELWQLSQPPPPGDLGDGDVEATRHRGSHRVRRADRHDQQPGAGVR
jgi:hypothetical protein